MVYAAACALLQRCPRRPRRTSSASYFIRLNTPALYGNDPVGLRTRQSEAIPAALATFRP